MQTVFTPSAQTNFIYFKGDIDNALSTFLQLQNREKGTNCCSSVHGSNTSLYWPRSLQKYKGGASTWLQSSDELLSSLKLKDYWRALFVGVAY